MAPTTRQQAADPLPHLLDNVFALGPTSTLRQALSHEGIDNIYSLLALTETDIDQLEYTLTDAAGNATLRPLERGHRSLLHALHGFVVHRNNHSIPIGFQDWTSVTADEFNQYRLSADFILYNNSRAPAMKVSPVPNRNHDPVDIFKHGIKCDPTYKLDDAPFPSETYKTDDASFHHSESHTKKGYFVGITEHVGHAVTYQILTDDTNKIIFRSNVRSALDPHAPNLHLTSSDGESHDLTSFIKSKKDDQDSEIGSMPVVTPADLSGQTFLMDKQENGQCHRARIVEATSSPSWKGLIFNAMVEWENGEITPEPLSIIAANDPVTCAIYAHDNNLLKLKGTSEISFHQSYDLSSQESYGTLCLHPKKYIEKVTQSYEHMYATAETAMYGSEFVAACTCVEQIIDFHHIPGASNPTDILSKHWGYQQIWSLLKPLLFWSGDTAVI